MNLSSKRVRFNDVIFPLAVRSLRHRPPVPSKFLLVLVEASYTGLAGVVVDPLNTMRQGIQCCVVLSSNAAFSSSVRSLMNLTCPFVNSFSNAFIMAGLTSELFPYFLTCWSSIFIAMSRLGPKNLLSSPRKGRLQIIRPFS